MSAVDLPNRFSKYDGDHVTLRRIALTREHGNGLPSFPAKDKKKDARYKWFVRNYGHRCWEIDAMDPNDQRHNRGETAERSAACGLSGRPGMPPP
jgi:hypothetical protein